MNNIKESIIKYFGSLDSGGSSTQKIDTLLEYNKLGEYLNGSHNKVTAQYFELSDNEKDDLKTLYKNLQNHFTQFLRDDNEELKITAENAGEYAQLSTRLENKNDETSKLTIAKIQKALYKFAMDNGYDLSDMRYENADYNFIIKQVKKLIQKRQKREVNTQKALKIIKKPYNNSRLKASVKEYITKNKIPPLENSSSKVDLGNGEFDKPATQETNVCWALASINSLLATETGKNLLKSNRFYDKTTGIFAIHLQEAEDNNFHDGIYIVTPKDLQAETASATEGDATAYLIALKKYFEEVNQNPELAAKMDKEGQKTIKLEEGNYGFRFFEILTGGKFSLYDYNDANQALHNGIGSGTPADCGNYEYICDIMKNKKGAVVLAIAGHSISVIGTKNGKLLVQESNNDANFPIAFSDIERNHVIFNRIEDINGAPAYELSKDDFEHYINAVSFLKWKQ